MSFNLFQPIFTTNFYQSFLLISAPVSTWQQISKKLNLHQLWHSIINRTLTGFSLMFSPKYDCYGNSHYYVYDPKTKSYQLYVPELEESISFNSDK